MRLFQISIPKLTLLVIAASMCLSCSKDADLISDYVINDSDDISGVYAQLVNDTYFIDRNTSVVLDVLSNDTFKDLNKVTIVETSDPAFGTVVINEDKTLTYIPNTPVISETETSNETPEETEEPETTTETPEETEEPQTPTETPEETETATEEEIVEDTFVYTAEETNEAGEVTTSEATVTVSNAVNKVPTSGSHVFYVTTNGKSTNNGKTQGSAWDITHAFKAAKAGDIIHIKSGNYIGKNLIVENSGTSSNPIRFIGYKNEPGDIDADTQENYTLGTQTIKVMSSFKFDYSVNESRMPLIKENRSGLTGKGMGIEINGSNVHLSNLQTLYYENGLYNHGNNNSFKNLIIADIGDFSKDVRVGKGILNFGDNCIYKNIFIKNAADQGFTIRGNNGIYDGISVSCDNTVNATDYYFLLQAGNNNTATNIHVKRVGNLQHAGHGVVLKTPDPCYDNLIDGFIVDDTNLEAQYPGVHDNIIRNGYVLKRPVTTSQLAGGIRLINGSHDNYWENIMLDQQTIFFMDWNGDASGNITESSDGNIFNRITVVGAKDAVSFNYFQSNHSDGFPENNTFYNCTFYDTYYMFEDSRKNENTQFVNCLFVGQKSYKHTATGYSSYPLDIKFTNSYIYDSSFSLVNGLLSTINPLFKDTENLDFNLLSNSPLKGKGIKTPFLQEGNNIGSFQ